MARKKKNDAGITNQPVNTQNTVDVKPIKKSAVMDGAQKHVDPEYVKQKHDIAAQNKVNYNKAKTGDNKDKINADFKQIDKLYEDTRTTRSGETSTHRKTALSKVEAAQRNAIRADIAQKYGLTEKEVDKLYNNYTKQETVKRKAEIAKDHKLSGYVGAIGDNLASGLAGFADIAKDRINYAKGEDVTADDASHYFTNSKNATRQAISDDLKTDFGKGAFNAANIVGDLASIAGLSTILPNSGSADMLGKVVRRVPSLLSGGQEAERSMIESLERGADADDAFNAALSRGALQSAFSAIGYHDKPVNTVSGLLKNIGANALTEGLANVGQEMVSNKTDDYFLGQKSAGNQALIRSLLETRGQGLSPSERAKIAVQAKKDYNKQDYIDQFKQGALFGGITSGVQNLANIPRLQNFFPEPGKTRAEAYQDMLNQQMIDIGTDPEATPNRVPSMNQNPYADMNYTELMDTIGSSKYYLDDAKALARQIRELDNSLESMTDLADIQDYTSSRIDLVNRLNDMGYDFDDQGRLWDMDEVEAARQAAKAQEDNDYINMLNEQMTGGEVWEPQTVSNRQTGENPSYMDIMSDVNQMPSRYELAQDTVNRIRELINNSTPEDAMSGNLEDQIAEMSRELADIGYRLNNNLELEEIPNEKVNSLVEKYNKSKSEKTRNSLRKQIENEGYTLVDEGGDADNGVRAVRNDDLQPTYHGRTLAEPNNKPAEPKSETKPVKKNPKTEQNPIKETASELDNSDVKPIDYEETTTQNAVPQMNRTIDTNEQPITKASQEPEGGNVPPKNPTLVNDEIKGTDISRRYETLKKDPMIEASMLEKAREDGIFNKEIENRKQSQDDALREYVGNEEKVTQSNMEKKWDSGKDVDTSMLIAHDAIAEGNQAKANLAFLKQAIEGRRSGRILRAMRDYAFTKEGALAQATNYMADRAEEVLRSSKKLKADIESIAKEIVDNKSSLFNLDLQFFANTINPKLKQKIGVDIDPYGQQKILDALANGATQDEITNMIAMYKAVGKMGVSEASYDQLEDIWKQMQGMGVKSKSRADLVAKAYAVLADDIGGDRTWKEKWDSWRYLAMLGNPLTHIRNRVGNFSHYLTTEVSDNIAAAIEDRYARNHQMERTRSVLDGNDNKLVDATTKDADEVYIDLNDTGHKYNVKSEIGRARKAFSTKSRAGQTLNKANDYNSSKLEGADYDALKRKYGKSLARFLKANGADESIFNATDQASLDLLERGREFAIKQAKDATFHSYSQLANILTNASNSLAKGNVGEKGLSLAMEGVLPFKKTPINILKEGIKYSPVSIAKGLKKMAFDVKKGNATPTEIIGDISAGLTGTGIMALGAFLRANGWLNSRENEDYDVANAQAEQGEQGYAFRIPEEFGGGSYTLDWLAPFSLPLFVGATIVDLFDKKEADNEDMDALDVADNVIDALATIGEPITEMSMLNGINDALKQVAYSKTGAIGTLASNALTGYFTQGVPTLAGQIARSIDPYRRDTYVEKSGAVSKPLEKQLLKAVNKVPALNPISNLITGEDATQPYIDYKGNLQNNGGIFSAMSEGMGLGNNVVSRFLDNTLSPGYYKKGNVTETDAELNRLYESTGKDIYPYVTSGKVDNEKLSRKDKRKYQELFGGTTSELYDSVIKTDNFDALDDSQKVKLFTDLRDVAKNLADSEIGGKTLNKSDQKLVDMYTSEGKDAVIEYLTNKQILNDLGVRNTEKNQQALEEGGQEFIEQKSAEQQLKEEYGVSGKNALEAYNMGVSGEELQQLSTITLSGGKKGDYVDYATLHKALPQVFVTPEEYRKFYDNVNTFDSKTKNLSNGDLLNFLNAVDPDYWQLLVDTWYNSDKYTVRRNLDGTYEKVLK